ncbi:hypothetical protein FQZ97_863520 [compost metagenome]
MLQVVDPSGEPRGHRELLDGECWPQVGQFLPALGLVEDIGLDLLEEALWRIGALAVFHPLQLHFHRPEEVFNAHGQGLAQANEDARAGHAFIVLVFLDHVGTDANLLPQGLHRQASGGTCALEAFANHAVLLSVYKFNKELKIVNRRRRSVEFAPAGFRPRGNASKTTGNSRIGVR